jgi:endonuclease/exonuclease/phosphatase family metal-dependent hydrolase
LHVAAGWIVGVAIVGVAAIVVLATVAARSTGPLVLVEVLLPHLVLGTLVLAVVMAGLLRTRAMTVALAILVVVAAGRFGSDWISIPSATPAGTLVDLVSWNLEWGARPADAVAGPLLDHDADVVALQELTLDAAAALDADPRVLARYPYRLLVPSSGSAGVGILSALPMVDSSTFEDPPGMSVTLDVGAGRRLRVVNNHPLHGQIATFGGSGLPVGIDARDRDAALGQIRTRIEPALAAGVPLVLIGDYNTAPTEPGYAVLSRGLRDVQVEVGLGPGWTWRPSSLEWLGIGLLRIDLVLAGPKVVPVSYAVDCAQPGDHCIVAATVVVQ